MEGLFALLIIFLVLSALRGVATQSKRGSRAPRRRLPSRAPAGSSAEPTTIRDLLDEFRRSMDETGREEVEDRTSLEIEPVVVPRPLARRAEPEPVDFDDEAEAVIEERRRWAEVQSRGLTAADHRAFDARIRKPAAQPVAQAPSRAHELRRMIVWREVLGPPVALRQD